jgi:hypothetical protein
VISNFFKTVSVPLIDVADQPWERFVNTAVADANHARLLRTISVRSRSALCFTQSLISGCDGRLFSLASSISVEM